MPKKNNKLAILFTLLLFSLNSLFAFNNNQKIEHIDSDLSDGIKDLYLAQSLAMPSSAAPYSDSELIMMLDLLDSSKFSKADANVYKYIKESLTQDDKKANKYSKVNWDVDLNLESYIHQNTTDFIRRENFIYNFLDQKPLINIGFEAWMGKNFYGLGNFSIASTYTTETTFGSETISHNIVGLPPNQIFDLDFNFPYRGFLAFGDDTWSLEIGRDRTKWGHGISSNLMIGDNLPYLDELRYTTYSNQFKYTFITSFFPHPQNYIAGDPTEGLGQSDPVQGTRAFIAHRGEGRLFNNKVGIALSESIMYQSLDNVLDLRYLSPTALFHNFYIRANANSLLSLELDYTPFKNFNIYAQGVMDEYALPGEPYPGGSSTAFPNAFGYIAGVKYNYDVLNKYKGNTTFEFAHTDPYLYLRGDGTSNMEAQTADEYAINYVVAFREFASHGTWYHNEFLGYEYGGDAIVFNLNSSIKNYGKWNIETNLFYMLHGTFDKFTCWNSIAPGTPTDQYITPTTSHDNSDTTNTIGSRDPSSNIADRDAVSQTLVLGASASYNVNKNLNCFVQLDYININNYQNVSGEKTSDMQLVLSLSYSL